MPQTFVPVDEAAALEGVSYECFKKRLQRDSSLTVQTMTSEKGGKDRVLVALDSLSSKAIKTYQKKQDSQLTSIINENISTDGDDDEAWYVGVDISKYMKKYADQFYRSCELANRIKDFLNFKGKNKTQYTSEYARSLGLSDRQFRRKVDQYIEGGTWAMEMEELDGKNYDFYKILALCHKPRERKSISLNDEMKAVIQNIWFDKAFATNQRKQSILYGIFVKYGEKKSWPALPSYSTVNRYINELSDKYSAERVLAGKGIRELKRTKMIKRKRNTGMLKVMELVQGDAHTFDCWVKATRPNGKTVVFKPYLAGLIDTRSRVLAGWAICEVPNNDVIKQMLMHMMYAKHNNPVEGVPRIILIDNGKDWTSKALTGRNRTERVCLDGEIKGFYKSVGIEDDMRSLPYQAWTKAQIERFFGTLCGMFTAEFNTYVGTLTGSLTSGKIRKDIKAMEERDEIISIEEFAKLFDKWLNEVYHMRDHKGLKDQKEPIPKPLNVFMEAERYFKAAPPIEYTRTMLMKAEERHVYSVGIKLGNEYYRHESLGAYIDQKVDVRYNPSEPQTLHVYDKNGDKLCEAMLDEGLHPLAPQGNQELTDHMKSQKRQIRKIGENLLMLQTPFEERNMSNDGRTKPARHERKVILPELKNEAPKVVSMPDDKQYKDEVKSRKKKAAVSCDDYFDRQFEKAMAKL